MTDAELRDAAWLALTKTTDSYPTWKRKGFPPTNWAKAKALLDQIGAAAPPPPPPATGLSPIGYLNNSNPGWWPPTNLGKYGITAAYGPAPAGFNGIGLRYMTALTAYPRAQAANGVAAEDALANGWILKDAAGQPIKRGGQYATGYVADVGHPGYQSAFAAKALELIAAAQAQGVWVDDSTPRITSLTAGEVYPAKYPTDAAYEDAVFSFMSSLHGVLKSRGLVDVYNTGVPLDNTAALTQAWWRRVGPVVGGLCVEGWMTPESSTAVRRTGAAAWDQRWDEWRALHGVCQQAGCHFFPMNWDRGAQEYALATFLLDWDGKTGSCQYNVAEDGYVLHDDPWSSVYDRALALGQPTGPAVKVGNEWRRPFAGGTVRVDPVAGTAAIG